MLACGPDNIRNAYEFVRRVTAMLMCFVYALKFKLI
jgi:hypothetical protein